MTSTWRMRSSTGTSLTVEGFMGEFGGIAGIGIFRFSDGKVVESWDNFDQLGMMRQLGVIPSPEQSQ